MSGKDKMGKDSSGSGSTARVDGREGRVVELSTDHVWPLAIALGLAAVVLVNILFIYIAVSDADPVVPSYVTEHR